MLIELIAAFFVSYSFGILFNIKGKYLIIAGGGGSLGWFLYKICLYFGFGESSSLFVASIGFSIYCESCARLYKTPSTALLFLQGLECNPESPLKIHRRLDTL